jgi:hypothetical protein
VAALALSVSIAPLLHKDHIQDFSTSKIAGHGYAYKGGYNKGSPQNIETERAHTNGLSYAELSFENKRSIIFARKIKESKLGVGAILSKSIF